MSDAALTILATPKPFHGHIGIIQRNAICSWTQLQPRPQIYLFGEQEGTAETAAELGIHHLRGLACSEFGTPLLNDLLQRARNVANASCLGYLNCDIILLQEFLDAVISVSRRFPKFLCVAHRLNVDVATPLTFDAGWQKRFRREVLPSGWIGDELAIDAFAFQRDLYTELPPLILGRAWFDQWLIKDAIARGVPVADLSRVAQAIHQNHEYSHIEGGQQAAYWGVEAQRNLEIYGGVPHAYSLLNVTHELLPDGEIRRVRFRKHNAAVQRWFWKTLIAPTAAFRRKIGLHRRTAIHDNRTAKA